MAIRPEAAWALQMECRRDGQNDFAIVRDLAAQVAENRPALRVAAASAPVAQPQQRSAGSGRWS